MHFAHSPPRNSVEQKALVLLSTQREGMDESYSLTFGPFRFDCARDRLWREERIVELRAKPLSVLRYLLERHGKVVTRNELFKEVWPGIYVSKTTLRVCLREIRLALGDEATAPQYIET